MMTAERIVRGLLWGPLTPERYRKAMRHITSQTLLDAVLREIPRHAPADTVPAMRTALTTLAVQRGMEPSA